MGALPPFRQIGLQSLPGAPAWFNAFLAPLNQFLAAVFDIVNSNTTLGQNVPAQFVTVTVSVASTGAFAAPSISSTLPGGQPQAVLLARVRLANGVPTQITAISLNQWDYVAGKVQMTVVGMQPACTYQLTFLLL